MRTLHRYKILTLLVLMLAAGFVATAQPGVAHFRKLGFAEGLHDGIIRCIAQDRFGYMWFGTAGAINRFDGRRINQYTNNPADSTSPYGTQTRCMYSDPAGRFWIGTELGLMEYDFKKGNFQRIPAFYNIFILSVNAVNDSILFLNTRKGLFRYNTRTHQVFSYWQSQQPVHAPLQRKLFNSMCISRDRVILGSPAGLTILDAKSDSARNLSFPAAGDISVLYLDADKAGNIWLYGNNTGLAQIPPDLSSLNRIPAALSGSQGIREVAGIMSDREKGLWIITEGYGLLHYVPGQAQIFSYHYNINYPSGPSSNSYRSLFQDRDGQVWLGCYVEGINYFQPGDHLFSPLVPFPDGRSKVGRAITTDQQGFIWMGNHDGLSRFDPRTQEYKTWQNEPGKNKQLYSNVIRSLECDGENNIWIGTGNGVNRYNSRTGQIEFIDNRYLPNSFYNSINKDRSGHIWFCTNDTATLYWYDEKEKQFHSISDHPQLKQFVHYSTTSYLYEDREERLWISFSRNGVLMLDKKTGELQQYKAPEDGKEGIIGNQVIEIKEDQQGIIWLSTFNGISGIDLRQKRFYNFSNRNGLPGNMAAPLAIDKEDRIWAGVNGGLTMISADRKHVTTFSTSEGLPSLGFHEHAGYSDSLGNIFMPTYYGYFRFNPAEYRYKKPSFSFYLAGYSISDQELKRISEAEVDPQVRFGSDQQSFTFHLSALNYNNPSQTWFVYRLDGFENEWHYTRDPKAVYTNVPGGNYTFLYKATLGKNNYEDTPYKKIQVHVATRFYKTAWFRGLLLLTVAALFYGLYRYRTRQQRQMFVLKEKAQLLEKEKALVMYESLKQQLNPHFLFNSLTSLNSLISEDTKKASGFLDSLSKTYRYILKSRDSETVPLGDEIRFAELYSKLQLTRFEKGFEVHFDVSPDEYDRKIVPVTLQNLIENAIKHNIIDEETPLLVKIFTTDDYLVVTNNLQRKNFVETSNKQGLANLISLYHYLSSRPVEITEDTHSFIVKIPLL